MSVQTILAYIALIWYVVVVAVAVLGFVCIILVFKKPPKPTGDLSRLEPVTIIRPIKGVDPELVSCLELSFLQEYPRDKLQILFCVYEADDPAIPILEMLVAKYPETNAEILISAPFSDYFGPNPKVNNLAKGFLAAKHDLVWVMDLNVWASPLILANSVSAMVDNKNCGTVLSNSERRVKLVHHVPLALSLDGTNSGFGSLLDEMFLFTSHLKFYVSLNNVSIAPCVNGKSNMYRKSDLDHAVSRIPYEKSQFFSENSVKQDALRISEKGPGHLIEFFARYIGEDNMIAIALWENCTGRTALTGDIVIQPLVSQNQSNSTREYFNRRVRWLRVRKYMVKAATLVEPSTESIICGFLGTFAISTLVWKQTFNVRFFLLHMACWLVCDYCQYYTLAHNINNSRHMPLWLQNIAPMSRSLGDWIQIWLLREAFALPIWIEAMVGQEINWRGRPFKIKTDLSAEEL